MPTFEINNRDHLPVLVFTHGWSFDANLWTPLRQHLESVGFLTTTVDFVCPSPSQIPNNRKVLAIGHSTGVLWLLSTLPFAWDALVSINGFTCFTERPDFPEGVRARIVKRMHQQLELDSEKTIQNFHQQCGLHELSGEQGYPARPLDSGILETGMKCLLENDARSYFAEKGFPALALYAKNDPIVPPTMAQACFESDSQTTLQMNSKGGHLLPLSETEWCAQTILQFVTEFHGFQ